MCWTTTRSSLGDRPLRQRTVRFCLSLSDPTARCRPRLVEQCQTTRHKRIRSTPIFAGGSTTPTANSQILPFTLGSNGALQAQTGGAVPDDPTQENPIYLVVESKTKWLYLANQGNNNNTSGAAASGITGYVIDPAQHTLSQM